MLREVVGCSEPGNVEEYFKRVQRWSVTDVSRQSIPEGRGCDTEGPDPIYSIEIQQNLFGEISQLPLSNMSDQQFLLCP